MENSGNVQEILRIGSLADIPEALLKWYDVNKRRLPWRENPTPYRVWISEIMLQQTKVEAVKPYFDRFMERLPDVRALAEISEEGLLKLWEGLGYYSRARNLRQAALRIMESGGRMPENYSALLKLPGIGSYTAGAIASIAYREPVPAVDGNVLRVLSRIRGDDRNISDPRVKTAVEQELRQFMPKDRPGDFNQALMELGACVCVPNRAPMCEHCPLAGLCRAHELGAECDYPKKAEKKPRALECKTVLVLRDGNRIALRKRPDKGLLAGMYEFPSLEGFRTAEEVAAFLLENGIRILRIQPLEDARHIFTHREWHMKGYMVRVDGLENISCEKNAAGWLYVQPEETREKYPIPSAYKAYVRYLKNSEASRNWNKGEEEN